MDGSQRYVVSCIADRNCIFDVYNVPLFVNSGSVTYETILISLPFLGLTSRVVRLGSRDVNIRGNNVYYVFRGDSIRIFCYCLQRWVAIQWTPCNPTTLGTNQSVLIRGVASFQGGTCIELVFQRLFWDFSKRPEYRGGHISGVQIRGSSQ